MNTMHFCAPKACLPTGTSVSSNGSTNTYGQSFSHTEPSKRKKTEDGRSRGTSMVSCDIAHRRSKRTSSKWTVLLLRTKKRDYQKNEHFPEIETLASAIPHVREMSGGVHFDKRDNSSIMILWKNSLTRFTRVCSIMIVTFCASKSD